MKHRIIGAALACVLAPALASAADWMQFGYDAAHSGHNTAESRLGADNVAQLTRRWHVDLDSDVDGAPVYLSGVSTAHGVKNVLYLLGTDGRLMAIDAADGTLVWSHRVSGQQPTTSSPAIDPGRQYVYAYGLDGAVHRYRVGNGVEVSGSGWPERVTLKTDVEKVAGSLTIGTSAGTNYLYVVTDGYAGDAGDYQGHLVAIDLSTGAQKTFNTLCSNVTSHLDHTSNDCDRPTTTDFGGSGIWGRGGATFDAATNQVYVATGNGWFDGATYWGDSVLALAPNGTGNSGRPRDNYTPDNYMDLFTGDVDLGSVSLAILPIQGAHAGDHLGVQLGKDAMVRIIDLDDMNGANTVGTTGGELSLANVPQGGGGMSEQPATWLDPAGNTWLLIANNAGVSGMKLRFGTSGTPSFEPMWQHAGNAKSAIVANGVLYYAASCSGGYCLNAADPVSGDVLWTSDETLASLHWQSPILVDSAIYIADGSTLHRFDANLPDDIIFASGFE